MPIISHFLVNFTADNYRKFFSLNNFANIGAQVLIVLLFWGCLWGLFSDDAEPPDGYIYNILLVVVMAHIFGKLSQLFNLPKLIGMIIIGFLLANKKEIGGSPLELGDGKLTRILRHIALVVVIIRSGLELNCKKLRQLSQICLRLALVPCIVETGTTVITTYYILGFPITWGYLLGFMLSAVSPAVIIPPILNFKKNGLGMDKGIPTILIAAASIDDILAITGFGLCIKLIFKGGHHLLYILMKVPLEPLIGVMTGIMVGLILWYIPSAESSEPQKLILLLFAGLASHFTFTSSDMRAAGPESCFVSASVASIKWRSDQCFTRIENDLKDLWVIFEPILFGLMATDVKISDMKDSNLFLGFICLLIGIIVRFLATICVTFGANFTLKEKIFIGFAWMPKATLQIAVAPLVLEMARDSKDDQELNRLARQVLDITFLSVLLTAPLGAIAISILGPKILTKSEENNLKSDQIPIRSKP